MMIVKCAKCGRKVFKYKKIGKGRLWHCWRDRISEDYSVRDGNEIRCPCGNLIGMDERKWIKMKQHAFTCSGR
jgi:DNA-directed RNA polymerase subunit RPC12/RpoP